MKKIICTVSNDLCFDQRMQRICNSLSCDYKVLLVGRKLKNSLNLVGMPFEQKRLKCFFNKGKFFYIEYNIRLLFFLLSQKFDAVCSVDLDTLLAGTIVAKIKRKKLIYDAHEYFTEVPEVVERPTVKKIWSRIASFCIPKCDEAYTVCNTLADIFKEKYGKPFHVIRNLPSLKTIETKDKENNLPLILIYQGMLNDGRGIEEMLEALTHFESKQVEFWIAGEGDLSDLLRIKAEQLKLGDKVKFLGFIRPEELKQISVKADIGINLLKNKGLNYYYSLANKFFDYVMAEKPSINMDFPEYRIHNNEFKVSLLIKDLSAENIINAISDLVNDKIKYNELKLNCSKAKLLWNWELEEKKLSEIYKNLFNNKKGY